MVEILFLQNMAMLMEILHRQALLKWIWRRICIFQNVESTELFLMPWKGFLMTWKRFIWFSPEFHYQKVDSTLALRCSEFWWPENTTSVF